MPKFSILIVNYNGGDYVQGALASLARQSFRDFEVFLVDNGSTDGSVDDLDTANLPAFTLMRQTENLGFAAANNRAACAASGEWLVLLNADAVARPDWLASLETAIARHPGVAMLASAQYVLGRTGYLDGVGDAYLIFGFPWRGGFGHLAHVLPPEGECFSPCGAGAVYHREAFLSHNGFDERFFCYCEDVDLGFRMRLAGERCVFVPDAVIHHAGSGLSGRTSDFTTYHGVRNRVWTYGKNMPLSLLALSLPGHLALSAYLLVRAGMTGRGGVTWRAMRDGWLGLGKARRRSDWSPPRRRASLWSLMRAMAWNPFRMSGRHPHVRAPRPPRRTEVTWR